MSDTAQSAVASGARPTGASSDSLIPILRLGFRPFFFCAGLSACAFMLLWVSVLSGVAKAPYFDATLWHAHEMVFGFSSAMLAGFLLTASQAWTGIPGVKGLPLLGLVLLWIAGRLVPFVTTSPSLFFMVMDLAFMPMTAILMFRYLKLERQKHNRIFFLCFAALFVGNALVHAHVLAPDFVDARVGLKLGLAGMVLALVVVGGRVIPMFTRNAVMQARVEVRPRIEKLAIWTTFLWALGKVGFEATWWAFVFGGAAAIVHFVRWWLWHPMQSRHNPILWILHVGYLWLIIGFFFDAMGVFGVLPSAASHAFAVGGIGVVGYGMMSRVALGHTGHPIRASKLIVAGYVALNLATAIRVFMPLFLPGQFNVMVLGAGLLWAGAFFLFLWRYTPVLFAPRADGKPG